MNCSTFEANLEAFCARDLTPAERVDMEEHAQGCAFCRAQMERAVRLDVALREGLLAAAAMTSAERAALRAGVLAGVERPRPVFWSRRCSWPSWLRRPARVAAVLALVAVIVFGLALWGQGGLTPVSAAEVITRAQAAMDEHTGLSGVIHWQTSLEQWESDEVLEHGFELWFDFDDPGRYRLQQEFGGVVIGDMARNGVDHLWTYSDDAPLSGGESSPYVEEIVLSPDEMRDLARWHVPSPGRDDLTLFADMLPDVQVVGESEMAGRRVYLLRGKLFTLGSEFNPDGSPRPTETIVTLAVDAETYWLLGREERLPGEDQPRIRYRTERFELLPPAQVPAEAFAFSPPAGVPVRHLEGLDSVYRTPCLPSMPLEEAATAASFVLYLPAELPGDMEALPHVLMQAAPPDGPAAGPDLIVIYKGAPGRQILLVESPLPKGPAFSARPVRIGRGQGWLESDLIDARQFTIHLPNWEVPELYATREVQPQEGMPGARLPPGHVQLHAWGVSVDEALAVLESLVPFEP